MEILLCLTCETHSLNASLCVPSPQIQWVYQSLHTAQFTPGGMAEQYCGEASAGSIPVLSEMEKPPVVPKIAHAWAIQSKWC